MIENRRGNRVDILESPTNRNKKTMIRRRNTGEEISSPPYELELLMRECLCNEHIKYRFIYTNIQ